jgi:hypothetical protein
MSEFPGLDSWIEGDRVCSYCGMHVCICEPEAGEGEQAMSTDALRDKLDDMSSVLEKLAGSEVSTATALQWLEQDVAAMRAALVAPAGETEKLPAKWRAEAEKCCPSKFEPCNRCKQQLEDATELEAALKADRQGGMR